MAAVPDSEAEQRAERIRELLVLCLELFEEEGGTAVEAIVRANPDVAASCVRGSAPCSSSASSASGSADYASSFLSTVWRMPPFR
jgi:hypothetical protein